MKFYKCCVYIPRCAWQYRKPTSPQTFLPKSILCLTMYHFTPCLHYMVVCSFHLSPHASMSTRESDQTQYVHKTLQLCKVQWSRSTKKCNWAVSRWRVWFVCNVHTSGQITERKSLWADIQNLFINIGWMTNLWPDIFSLLQSIYFII